MAPYFLFRIIFFVILSSNFYAGKSSFIESEYLNVPTSEFVRSISSAIDIVQQMTVVVSQSSGPTNDFRLSNAIADCLDLMDLSVDQLSRTMSVLQNPSGEDYGTGDVNADMNTWLSAALANQDTCLEGLDGTTNTILKNQIATSQNQVTSLIYDLLSMITPPNNTPNTRNEMNQQFPDWLKFHDLETEINGANADVVVAIDGSGDFTTITDAINAAPEFSRKRYVIYVKKGVYKEYVDINKKKWNITIVGDGMDVTVISGNRNTYDGWSTYRSATFGVKGPGFIARDITFENTAGPEKHQAVAFRSDSDLSVLYRCAIRGYQDTLYAHGCRQFYRECKITGTVDFIFSKIGTAVFQKCHILARKGLPKQKNTITADGRNNTKQTTGISIQFCNISVDQDVLESSDSIETYLGRPWGICSRTIIMQSYISDAISPEGWLKFREDRPLDDLYYGEYMNYGPGARLDGRVKWPGYHVIDDPAQASKFTVAQFIKGNTWLPSTGVKYSDGLLDV